MSLTVDIAGFIGSVTLDAVPRDVRHIASRSILDGLGLAVAGSRGHAAELARAEIASYGLSSREATVLGTDMHVPARFAAFLNGLAIHADDFDDTQLAERPDRVYGLLMHPTAPVLAAVLAIGERAEIDGSQLLLAYLLGTEVACKVAEAIDPRHYGDGFHSTATIGTIGAAAGSARLLGLDRTTTAVALSLGASQAAGLRENFGTMTKPFHAGRAAEGGVLAASLARAGFTATTAGLEAPRGFFKAAGGGFDPTAIDGTLGDPWTYASPGISIKPHPSGSLTHPAMGAVLDLVVREDLRPSDVASVRIATNRHMPNALIQHDPRTGLAAKFSMEYCVAILIVERRAGLAEFEDDIVNRADIREVMQRVTFEADPAADEGGFREMTSLIEIRLNDGRVLKTRADFGKGSPANPMSDDELIEKFLDCLAWAEIPASVGREVADRVLDLSAESSIRDVVRMLSAPGVGALQGSQV